MSILLCHRRDYPYHFFSMEEPNSKNLEVAYEQEPGCGFAFQMLLENWQKVTRHATRDVTMSFEFIEGLPKLERIPFVENLLEISSQYVIIGSLNKTGPNEIEGLKIRTTEKDEYSFSEWRKFFEGLYSKYDPKFYGSLYSHITHSFGMMTGHDLIMFKKEIITNYVVLRK